MADILNQAKNILAGKDPNTPKSVPDDNRLDRIDQCKLIWYQWLYEIPNSPQTSDKPPQSASNDKLTQAISYDISNHIESVTFSKPLSDGAGTFSFTLNNSFDWSRYMKPGQWLLIFLSSEGDLPLPTEEIKQVNTAKSDPSSKSSTFGDLAAVTGFSNITSDLLKVQTLPLPLGPSSSEIQSYKDKLRCLGIIQRVGVKSHVGSSGEVEISFAVSGKDFGMIYEETELWFNANQAEEQSFTSLITATTKQFQRNLGELLNKYHDIFLNFDAVFPKGTNPKRFLPQQWVMPDQLLSDLGLSFSDEPYFGNLDNLKEFSPTIFQNPDPNPLAGMEGTVWERMKNLSQPEFHELFTELSDAGNPKLYFRPIPWAIDKSGYPTIGSMVLAYKDLASGNEIQPPAAINTSGLTGNPLGGGLSGLTDAAQDNLTLKSTLSINSSDIRTFHSVDIDNTEVIDFDLGQDLHSRYNFFLVDNNKSIWDQSNIFAVTAQEPTVFFPFRNENSIKRFGFRPMHVYLNSFNLQGESVFGTTANEKFIKETNRLLQDLYERSEDLYSGQMTIFGKNDIKLGKVIRTFEDFTGLPNMIFYIEGYTDSFTLDAESTGVWTQNLLLTRGFTQECLIKGGNSKDKQATQSQTFHPFNRAKGSQSKVQKIKNAITSPKSLF